MNWHASLSLSLSRPCKYHTQCAIFIYKNAKQTRAYGERCMMMILWDGCEDAQIYKTSAKNHLPLCDCVKRKDNNKMWTRLKLSCECAYSLGMWRRRTQQKNKKIQVSTMPAKNGAFFHTVVFSFFVARWVRQFEFQLHSIRSAFQSWLGDIQQPLVHTAHHQRSRDVFMVNCETFIYLSIYFGDLVLVRRHHRAVSLSSLHHVTTVSWMCYSVNSNNIYY